MKKLLLVIVAHGFKRRRICANRNTRKVRVIRYCKSAWPYRGCCFFAGNYTGWMVYLFA